MFDPNDRFQKIMTQPPRPRPPAKRHASSSDGYVERQKLNLATTDPGNLVITNDMPAGDEHHTMDELYDYRMAYNAYAVMQWIDRGLEVTKSWKHHDGEPCFGGGWFIVTAMLPTGQVSNHYKSEYWDLFNVPAVPLAPVWDGHTPAIALQRMIDDLYENF